MLSRCIFYAIAYSLLAKGCISGINLLHLTYLVHKKCLKFEMGNEEMRYLKLT